MEQNERALVDYLNNVKDKATFLDFVLALTKDRKVSTRLAANEWENTTIEGFLDAALAWAEDSGKLPDDASWKAFAEFLYCGKIYE